MRSTYSLSCCILGMIPPEQHPARAPQALKMAVCSLRAHSQAHSSAEQTLPPAEVPRRKTCLLRWDPRHQSWFTLCEVSWSEVTCMAAQTQPTLLRSQQNLPITQDTGHHHSSSWLNWCQSNDTAASDRRPSTQCLMPIPLSKPVTPC